MSNFSTMQLAEDWLKGSKIFVFSNTLKLFYYFNFTEHSGKLTVPSLRALCRQFEVNLKDDELLDMVR